MTRPNKNPVHVTAEFRKATIDMIKKILSSNQVIRHNNYDKNKSIAFNVLNTDVSIDCYNYYNGTVEYCDLYIGSDAIRYVREEAQALHDAFHARWSEQSKEKTAEKEAELTAKLRNYMNSGNAK
jgi:hypothetical protein